MIEGALKPRDAVTLYQQATPDLEVEDVLLPTDWAELTEFKKLLTPLARLQPALMGLFGHGSPPWPTYPGSLNRQRSAFLSYQTTTSGYASF